MSVIKIAVMAIPNGVFYPHTQMPLHIAEPTYIRMIKNCILEEVPMAVAMAIPSSPDRLSLQFFNPSEICGIGIPHLMEDCADGTIKILIKGIVRVRLVNKIQDLPFPVYEAEVLADRQEQGVLSGDKVDKLRRIFNRWLKNAFQNSIERENFEDTIHSLHHLVDCLSTYIVQDTKVKQMLLECDSLFERVHMLDILFEEGQTNIENPVVSEAIKQYDIVEVVTKLAN
jgi:Lon protease-like protein